MPEFTSRLVEAHITRELRRSVLRPAFAIGSSLPGDDDPQARQLAVFAANSDDPVCACVLLAEPCPWLPDRPAWRLRSMATAPAWRGRGAGRVILRAAKQIALEAGVELLWCEARQGATALYRSLDWQEFGDLFETDYGPHRLMWLELRPNEA